MHRCCLSAFPGSLSRLLPRVRSCPHQALQWVAAFVLACACAPASANDSAPAPKPATPATAEDKRATPQPTKPSAPSAAKPETIEVTATSSPDNTRRDDTATKIVVTAEEINKYGDTQLYDVMRRLPGVTVSGTEVRMRGLGAGYTQILINGERAPPGFTLDTLSPTQVERIEVLRAATAEFSTQSVAGTINIVLKQKVSVAQRELKAGIASGHDYFAPNANFTLSDRADKLSWSLNGFIFQARYDNKPVGEDIGTDAAGNVNLYRTLASNNKGNTRGMGFSPRLNWTISAQDSLSWQTFFNAHRNINNGERRHVEFFGAPLLYPVSMTRNESEQQFGRSELQWVRKFAEGGKLDTKLGVNFFSRDSDFTQAGFNQAGAQNLDSLVVSDSKDRGVTFTGKYNSMAVDGHALVVGWDGAINKRSEIRDQRDRPLPGVVPVVSYEDFDAEVKRIALFAQDEWNVTDLWSVYAGLRWELVNTQTSGNTFATTGNRSSVVSPIFQTLWKFPDKSGRQLRFALTRTYKAPQTAQIVPRRFTSTNNGPTEPDNQGNRDLKPELATGIDVAYEHFWAQGAMLSLAGSIRRITDYTRREVLFINGRWVALPINDGTANTKSLEFEAKFPVQTVWKEAPPMDVRLNLSRNWSRVESVPGPNNRLDQQTPFSATIGLDYRMKSGEVVAGGSYSFKSGGEVRISDTQFRYQSVRREMDVYLLWKFTKQNSFRLTLANVLRQDNINQSRYADAFGSLNQIQIFPSSMHVRANLEMKF